MLDDREIEGILRGLERDIVAGKAAIERAAVGYAALLECLDRKHVSAAAATTTTFQKAAGIAKVSERTMRRWIAAGHDLTEQVGARRRVSLNKLARFLEGYHAGGASAFGRSMSAFGRSRVSGKGLASHRRVDRLDGGPGGAI